MNVHISHGIGMYANKDAANGSENYFRRVIYD